jgi:thiamine biosynthesis lipoprotein ApbE
MNKNDSHSQQLRLLPFLSLAPLILSRAAPPQVRVEREAYIMGTTLRIAVAAPSRSAGIEAIEEAFQAVRQLDGLLSTWRDDSEIARPNHAPPGRATSLC